MIPDCSYVVDSWNFTNKSQLTCGWAVNATLRERIFELAEDIGEEHIFVSKVKAHRKLHRHHDQYTRLCIAGNGFADKCAKWGVGRHTGSGDMRKFIASGVTAYKAVCKELVASVMEASKRQGPRSFFLIRLRGPN